MKFMKFISCMLVFFSIQSMASETEEGLIKKRKVVSLNDKSEENNMEHIQYILGAFKGATLGSFLIHCFDTYAVRSFGKKSFKDSQSYRYFSKREFGKTVFNNFRITIKSYVPVLVGVVPMRAASFGVYGVVNSTLINHGCEDLTSKITAATTAGISLSLLSTLGEIYKTRKQIEATKTRLRFSEVVRNFTPLSIRVVPSVVFMIAGTESLIPFMPFSSPVLSTGFASIISAMSAQIFGTPAENIRAWRIKNDNYKIPTYKLLKKLGPKVYTGALARGMALGIQGAFTIYHANLAALPR